MKKKWLVLLMSLSLFLASIPIAGAEGPQAGGNTLILYTGKANISYNGVTYTAAQPTVIKAGVTYAAFSALAARYGYKVSYDAATKESVAKLGNTEIRFKAGSTVYKMNGESKSAAGKPYVSNGSTMIPVRAWANATGSTLTAAKGQITLSWSTAPTANFRVTPDVIYANQTTVTYISESANPQNIVEEYWEGNQTIFTEPGVYTITRSVRDAEGNWSAPYSVTITVRPENQPPIASFQTDKQVYKIGEPIKYIDLSSDDENAITETVWDNNKPAFFTPGEKTISLWVTDQHGLTSQDVKTITVTDEVMYTEEQFNQRFTPLGDKYSIDGSSVLKMATVPYTFTVSDRSLIASNSPEELTREGILYRDEMNGDFRLFLYHMNKSPDRLSIYLAATNENDYPVTVNTGAFGKAGPDVYGSWTGKQAAIRYLDSAKLGESSSLTLAPGETKLVLAELGSMPLKPGQTYSAYADLNTSSTVKFTLFAVKQDRNPLEALPTLGIITRDAKHIRGTFQGADRDFQISTVLGTEPQRILFGDNNHDPSLDGRDMLNGVYENNWGNYGVVYHTVVKVKANTLILANGRGGEYSGAFQINGTDVIVANNSMLKNPNEVAVLYRTGPYDEIVEISFITALGSYLPMNLLFIPME
jgi:PKD repeat protein